MFRIVGVLMLVLMVGLSGCSVPSHKASSEPVLLPEPLSHEPPEPSAEPEPLSHETQEPSVEPGLWHEVGRSVEDRPMRAWFGGGGDRTVFFMACIHGDERSGEPLMEQLIAHIEAHPELLERQQVIILPVANPDGLARRSRVNARNIDLNRNFPVRSSEGSPQEDGPVESEPEVRALIKLISEHQPDVIVAVHSELACIDYDGPAEDLARRMADRCGLPVRKLGAQEDSLGTYAGVNRNLPVITLELSSDEPCESSSWERIGPALLEVLDTDSDCETIQASSDNGHACGREQK